MKLTRTRRQELFKAEMLLARVHSHIWNRADRFAPEGEREALMTAMAIVWTLYRLAQRAQEAV